MANISKIATAAVKIATYSAVSIGASLWATDKVSEYIDKHEEELDNALGVVKSVGYMMFIDGVAVSASVIAYNLWMSSFTGWAELGKICVKAATEVSK